MTPDDWTAFSERLSIWTLGGSLGLIYGLILWRLMCRLSDALTKKRRD